MAELSDDQKIQLAVVELWNCRHAFEFVCPRYFDSLQPTEDPGVRFCPACREKVFFCRSPLDFVSHGEQGHCVALPEGFAPWGAFGSEMLGRPSRADLEAEERRVREVRAWWKSVLSYRPAFAPGAFAEVARYFAGPDRGRPGEPPG